MAVLHERIVEADTSIDRAAIAINIDVDVLTLILREFASKGVRRGAGDAKPLVHPGLFGVEDVAGDTEVYRVVVHGVWRKIPKFHKKH